MKEILSLNQLSSLFPADFDEEKRAQAQTLFYRALALEAHRFYGGKMQTVPMVPVYGMNWFNVWYTPGVSAVSTHIRDNNSQSFVLSNRRNLVAVVSDSTRVLGDGDCTPPGGLGVMEGKSLLMKYLAGVDATAICMDSRDKNGQPRAENIIQFVKMLQPGFGAINLEDISQPNCYKVLDTLREECDIPVWHDDAQGTACVTLAGIINALKLADKTLPNCKIVLFGAGAANTSIARLLTASGALPQNMILFDEKGSLHRDRADYRTNADFYPQWHWCRATNPHKILTPEEAFSGADIVIALSKPGPDTLAPGWIARMAPKAIVFACANPVPEIYPCKAIEAGAFIVATGRGDFPNQVNNSICFPSILKGTLSVAATKITDSMAITAARAIAAFAEKRGISPTNIIPNMMESDLFPRVAAEVAAQAQEENIAQLSKSKDEVYQQTKNDIAISQKLLQCMQNQEIIKPFPEKKIKEIAAKIIEKIR
ncbi:MAG: NAD-dependent malic enzyme [Bacteroidales bacterium]|nr:NAD-dependent malic enzyme [Bacteroidales bacterium]